MLTRFLIVVVIFIALCTGAVVHLTNVSRGVVPGPLPALTNMEEDSAFRMNMWVEALALKIGQRNVRRKGSMATAADMLLAEIKSMGYSAQIDSWNSDDDLVANLIIELTGTSAKRDVIVIAAHYDSYRRSPSANASGSGTAVLLELLKRMNRQTLQRTLRVVFLANGEWTGAETEDSGAVRYAQAAQQRGDHIVATLCLGPIGIFSDDPGSQKFPFPLSMAYPDTANFVAAFSHPKSRDLLENFSTRWSRTSRIPLVAGTLPSWFPGGVAADHDAFQAAGFPALVISDTGGSRFSDIRGVYESSHRLNYERMAQVVSSLHEVVKQLAKPGA